VAIHVGKALLVVGSSYRLEWNFPGGSVRPGETPAAAAKRELVEEIGLAAYPLLPAGEASGLGRAARPGAFLRIEAGSAARIAARQPRNHHRAAGVAKRAARHGVDWTRRGLSRQNIYARLPQWLTFVRDARAVFGKAPLRTPNPYRECLESGGDPSARGMTDRVIAGRASAVRGRLCTRRPSFAGFRVSSIIYDAA
jgi:ADP-ribose pyrophosphatase YjhB (NUDIX family)